MDEEPQESTKLLQAILNNSDQWDVPSNQEGMETDSYSEDSEEDLPSQAEEEMEVLEEDSNSDHWASNITIKYINGEVPFSEIANVMTKIEEETFFKPENEDKLEGTSKKKKLMRRKRKALPKALAGVLGAANLCFAQGKYEESIKICLEIIRQAPTAPEPFHLLGFVYDELGDREKALQFSLISAYLQPNDPQHWVELGAQALELNNEREALSCYNMALKFDPENLELYWAKCKLLDKMGDKKKLLSCYESILHLIPEEGKTCFELSRLIAKLYQETNNLAAAAQVLYKAYQNFPEFASIYDINDLLDMKFSLKKHKDAFKILQQYCNISLISEKFMNSDSVESFQDFVESSISCDVPENINIDFLAKLIICLIHLRASQVVPPLIALLDKENMEEIADLYLDVADAYMEAGEFSMALPLLTKILDSKVFTESMVWLKYADSLCALGMEDQAMNAYQRVVELSPKHLGARLSLSSLQKKKGMTDAAISTLKQDYAVDDNTISLDTELLFQRCKLLYSKNLFEEFIKEAKLLMCSHSIALHLHIQKKAVILNHTYKHKCEALREIQATSVESLSQFPAYSFTAHSIPDVEMWDLSLKLFHKLYEMKKFDELQNMTLQMLCSSLITKNPERAKDANFYALIACYHNKNPNFAYSLAKEFCVKDIHNEKAWTFFNHILLMSENIRHHRFCMRLLTRNQEVLSPVLLMMAHNSLSLGSLKFAIGAYTELLEESPEDPFLYFLIGVACAHMACQKFQARKNYLMFQGLVYIFRYVQLRGTCKETFYNLGRAFQHIGMNHLALKYYQQGLEHQDRFTNTGDEDGAGPEMFNLNREIAFNMYHIYQINACHPMAHYYIRKYCVL